jgi:hypothetical protein
MEIAEQFEKAAPEGGWQFWADLNGTIPLTREEAGEVADIPGGVVYATQEWHVKHCMHIWRKQYRSKWTGVTMEARATGLNHIQHCEKVFSVVLKSKEQPPRRDQTDGFSMEYRAKRSP